MRRIEHSHNKTSMIVSIIYKDRVAVVECKRQSPVTANIDRPVAFQNTSQWMKPPPGSVHVVWPFGIVQCEQLLAKPFGMLGLNTGFRSFRKELLDTSVSKALYHRPSV